MKKVLKFFLIILLIIIIALAGLQIWIYLDHTKASKKIVVVKSDVESFYGIDEKGELYKVTFGKPRNSRLKRLIKGKDLKMGQEIEIYWHGIINSSSPPTIGGVRKYKILKEESDIKISEYAKRYCYSRTQNVMLHVREITNEKLGFRILDTNEFPFEYNFEYTLSKRNLENEEYNKSLQEQFKKEQGIEQEVGTGNDDTTETNSTKPFNPDTSKYKTVWEIVNEKDVVSMDDVIKIVDSTKGHLDIEGMFDWTKVYGVLEPGEYQFVLRSKVDMIYFNCIVFNFVVDENGNVVCEPPIFEW